MKLDLKQAKRYAINVFETKEEMLKFVKKFAFKQLDRLVIQRTKKSWVVYLDE